MAKMTKKIGSHNLEAEYSGWTGVAKIRLDGQELLSKFTVRHTEIITVDEMKFKVKFGGIFFPDIEIQEI